MNRTNYSKSTLILFDFIGTFFVNIFLNDLYAKAGRELLRAQFATKTDAYRELVVTYMRASNNGPIYSEIYKSMHTYYQELTKKILVMSEFDNRIIEQFIPVDFQKDLSPQKKTNIIREIVMAVIQELGREVTNVKMLEQIIDRKTPTSTQIIAQTLQDKMIDFLILKREEYFQHFVNAINKKPEANATVRNDIFEKMRHELINLSKKNTQLKKQIEQLEQYEQKPHDDSALREQIQLFRTIIDNKESDIRSLNDQLQSQTEQHQSEIAQLKSVINNHRCPRPPPAEVLPIKIEETIKKQEKIEEDTSMLDIFNASREADSDWLNE